jgi:diguanylate cyclase (GGDEF)-like protein
MPNSLNRDQEYTFKTVVVPPPAAARSSNPLLVHIYPTGPGLGACYPLGSQPLVIGRDRDCEVCIPHSSVSRRHARVELAGDGFNVTDLQSTNGTYVNDTVITSVPLGDGDYLRVGNYIYRFLASSNIEAEYHEEIYRLTVLDALTDIHNKRHLLDFLERELARTTRYQRPLSVVLFDIDHFKKINDRLGHLGGDCTLRELAACIKAEIRREELFARYGGEEFGLVLPETPLDKALAVSERIRKLVENHPFHFDGEGFQITISIGVAATTGEGALTPKDLLAEADAKLYQAKAAGRNRVVG